MRLIRQVNSPELEKIFHRYALRVAAVRLLGLSVVIGYLALVTAIVL